jgi:hypothetical protein
MNRLSFGYHLVLLSILFSPIFFHSVYAGENGFGIISLGFPTSFYPSFIQTKIEEEKLGGSVSSAFRFKLGAAGYIRSRNSRLFLGTSFGLMADHALNNAALFQLGAGPSVIYFLSPYTTRSYYVRADLGPALIAGTAQLNPVGINFGIQTLTGIGYAISPGFHIAADYSTQFLSGFYQSFTISLTAPLLTTDFNWSNLLWSFASLGRQPR